MVLASHAIVGSGLVVLFPHHPIIGVIAAFLSHFLLDAIPHWDYPILSESANPQSGKKFTLNKHFTLDLIRFGSDALIGTLISFGIFGLDWLVFWGAAAAILPDFLQFVYGRLPRSPLKYLQAFHMGIHSKKKITHPILGITTQIVFVGALLLLFFYPGNTL